MADITFTGESDFSRVKKDYDDLSRRTAKLESENYRLRNTVESQAGSHQRVRREQGSMFDSGMGKLTNMIGGYLSMGAAIQKVTDAIIAQRAAQKDTLDAQVSQAAADATLIQNLVGQSSAVKAETIATLENLTLDLGIESATAVKAGFNEAISKAAGDVDLAMDATRRAAELQRATPENLQTYAAGGAVLSGLMGTRDTREAYGLLAEVQARSNISDPRELMAELPGAMAAMTATDARGAGKESVREAAALMAALGQAAQQAAAPTATAGIQLTSQLEKFFSQGTSHLDEQISNLEKKAEKIKIGGVRGPYERAAMAQVEQDLGAVRAEKAAVTVADPGTLAGRIEAIQRSQALQARLMPTLTGEGKFLEFFKQLLGNEDSTITQQFRRNVGTEAAPGLQIGTQGFDVLATELSGQSEVSKAVRVQAAEAARKGRGEAGQMADDIGATLAQIREEVTQALGQSNRSWVERLTSGAQETQFSILQGGDVQKVAELADQVLVERIGRIRNAESASMKFARKLDFTGVSGLMRRMTGDEKSDEDLTDDERQRIAALEAARRAVRQRAQDALNRARPEPTSINPQTAQPEPPAARGALGGASVQDRNEVFDMIVTTRKVEDGNQLQRLPAAVSMPELEESPAANLSRRVADLAIRPPRQSEEPARTADGRRIAESATTAVNLTGLEEAARGQLEKLDRLESTMNQMEKSFSRAAGRMVAVAALAELRER